MSRPPHHREDGRFQRTWPLDRKPGEDGSFLRWMRERRRNPPPPTPPRDAFPAAEPAFREPRAAADELTLTWVGHTTYLIQLGGQNILTDPHFSKRASPVQWMGPKRMAPLPVGLDDLPHVDAVVLSHDHFDHLDHGTTKALAERFPEATWVTPLAYGPWLARRGVRRHVELDWWKSGNAAGLHWTCVPVQHWCRRSFTPNQRLWSGWVVRDQESGRSVCFAGDSGYFHGFRDIGSRFGPFDASLIPIGAYAPRWFMRFSHMDPAEAVATYQDLGGQGTFAATHWGTFRLTDEDPLEPPRRAREAWASAGLEAGDLWLPRHGETRVVGR